MKASNFGRGMVPWDSYPSGREILNRREQGWSTEASPTKPDGRSADRTVRLMVALLAGLFSLWLSLTILGLLGLESIGHQLLSSLGLRLVVASGLGLIICVIGFPLFAPWFVAFVPVYLFIPRNSVLWRWWLCTLAGALAGIVALWTDALVCSLFSPGPSLLLNVPLLLSASIPAAVLGSAICFTAAISENAAGEKTNEPSAGKEDERTNPPGRQA